MEADADLHAFQSALVTAVGMPFPAFTSGKAAVEDCVCPMSLQMRHWNEIFNIIGADIAPGEDGTGEWYMTAIRACLSCTSNHLAQPTCTLHMAATTCLSPSCWLYSYMYAHGGDNVSSHIPSLKHWIWPGVAMMCCKPLPRSAGFAPFSIRQLLQFDLLEQLDKLQVVGAAASKEAGLEKALAKMQADWDGVAFRVVEYKDTGTFVIGGTDEVQVREA
jgi:hypothetical protein